MAENSHTLSLPKNRPDLEALIEAAIARLDDFDGDAELEDEHDAEPDDCEGSEVQATVHDYECGPINFGRAAS